jgi:hypothetical protein
VDALYWHLDYVLLKGFSPPYPSLMPYFSRRQFMKQAGAAAGTLSYLPNLSSQAQRPRIRDLPIEFGSDKNVFCDWRFVDAGYGLVASAARQRRTNDGSLFMPHGIKLSVGRPTLSEKPIIIADTPADGDYIGAYSTVLRDGGKYRLWYETYQPTMTGDADAQICYAESDDGFTWKKPNLGLFELNGSKNNNLVYTHGHGASIFIDPAASSSERYKMVHLGKVPLQIVNGKQIEAFVFGAVSPDGLSWKRLLQPLVKHTSDTQSIGEYDSVTRKYVLYLRGWEPRTHLGYGGRRIVMRAESSEFGNFSEPVSVLSLGPQDPPDADIYTNAYQRWPEAREAYLMTPAIYHRSSDHLDLRLATSRDGLRWQFPQSEPLLSYGAVGSGYEGAIYAGLGTLSLGKGKWAFPVTRYRKSHNMIFEPSSEQPTEGGLWLAMLREDGYIALEAEDEGECWTQPAVFNGSHMLINCSGITGAHVIVEIADEKGNPFPGYSLADCDGLAGEHLWSPMTWRGNEKVDRLSGKLVRIRFNLHRAQLHAFRFS